MILKQLIVIIGATASGKTDLSIEMAKEYGAEIISTDSRQFYRQMSIGTAVPSVEQLSEVKHHFIHSRDVWDNYAAGAFENDALVLLDELFQRGNYAVAVGGSGLYIDALCRGFDDIPTVNDSCRESLMAVFQVEGLDPLLKRLKELDPQFYEVVDRNNYKRVIRALEVCITSGEPYSTQRTGEVKQREFVIRKIGIDMPREVLYDRINRRVDMMVESGLEAEAREVYKYREFNALRTVGYNEMFSYFDGLISLDEAIDKIKQNTRRYAKRQFTWFRRDSDIEWIKKR